MKSAWFDWLVPLQAYKIIIVLFTFTRFSFLPNENTTLSIVWRWIPHIVPVIHRGLTTQIPNLLTQHGLTTRLADLADIPGLHNVTMHRVRIVPLICMVVGGTNITMLVILYIQAVLISPRHQLDCILSICSNTTITWSLQ